MNPPGKEHTTIVRIVSRNQEKAPAGYFLAGTLVEKIIRAGF